MAELLRRDGPYRTFNRSLTPEQHEAVFRERVVMTILMFLLPEDDETMNREKLNAMSTQDLVDLYNDLTQQQIKRMASKEEARKRTEKALRDAGKWEEDEPAGEAGEDGAESQPSGKGKGKGAGKAKKAGKASAVAEKEPAGGKAKKAAKGGKGKAGAKPSASKQKDTGKRRGAPNKNPTYSLVAPNSKERNPKDMKIQENSSRMKVLKFLEARKVPATREEIENHFDGQDVNVPSSLYFLAKHVFIRAKD